MQVQHSKNISITYFHRKKELAIPRSLQVFNAFFFVMCLLTILYIAFSMKSLGFYTFDFSILPGLISNNISMPRLFRFFIIFSTLSFVGTVCLMLFPYRKLHLPLTPCLILLTIGYCFINSTNYSHPLFDTQKDQGILIAHACGQIDGISYTNSMEALAQSQVGGHRFFEIDMIETEDHHIIGGHDWEHFAAITKGNGRTHEQARDYRIYDMYTVMDGAKIAHFFKKYPKNYLVSDKLNNFQLMKTIFPFFADRLLIEVFSIKNYHRALREGFKYPMLCIWNEEQLKNYDPLLKLNTISMITCPIELLQKIPEQLRRLHQRGVNIFVFTSNDPAFIKKYLGNTVTGFYTDSVLPGEI